MCPGFGGVKPHIDHYAELFAEAGFSVLNYDNRGCGTSEGEPRQEMQRVQADDRLSRCDHVRANHSRSSTPI